MKKFILFLTLTLTAVLLITSCGKKAPTPFCAVCGLSSHVSHPPCHICGINDHTSGTCCHVCYSTEHTVANHPFCTNCGSMYHPTEKCDLTESVYCEICKEKSHNTAEHPMCEIAGCDKKEFHSTNEHPYCRICGKKHFPYCENGDDAKICKVCGSKHTYEHVLCSFCNSAFHTADGHPSCTRCDLKHIERDADCPNFCSICMNLQHSTENHPRCTYCNSTAHTSEHHPKCNLCGKKHSPAFVCSSENPKSGAKATGDADPSKVMPNNNPCNICRSTNHSSAEHPTCKVCGNKHSESDANCPQKKSSSSGSGNQLCNYCGPNSNHITEFCTAVSCTYCGKIGHLEENCEEKLLDNTQAADDAPMSSILSSCDLCGGVYTPEFGCTNSMCPSNN